MPNTTTSQNPPEPSGDQSENHLRFWGVRGSIPTPGPGTVEYGGNTSCVELRADGQIIILDAGTGLRALGSKLLSEFSDRPLHLTLLLSHTHWDHIQGLPYFAPLYQSNCHLRIIGYEGAPSGLETVLSSQMKSPFFPVGLKDVPSNLQIDELSEPHFEVGDVTIDTWVANHPGDCVGYRLKTRSGTLAFFPDNEPPQRQQRACNGNDSNKPRSTQDAAKEEARMVEFVKGVDVLIMDAQYTAEEYTQHVGWGHGCVDDVVRMAMSAGVGRLFLFHHDPDHDDETMKKLEAHARRLVADADGQLQVEAAREGLQVPITQ